MKKFAEHGRLFLACLSIIVGHMSPVFLMGIALAGCGTAQPQQPLADVVLAPQTKTVNIPKELLIKCKPLPKLEVKDYTQKEFLTYLDKSVIDVSEDCRKKDAILVDTVIKAFNIQPEHPSK